MKILFLSNWFPFPPDNGSKIRIYNLIEALAENHEVTLISFADQPANEIDFNEPSLFGCKIHVVARTAYNPKRIRALVGFLALTPRSLVDTFSVEMRRCIESTLSTEGYDIVIASQLSMARYAASFRAYPSLFDEIELGLFSDAYFQAKSILPRLRNGLTWTKQIHYIRKLLKDYDACTVVSEAESSLLQRYLPQFQAVEVIPNAIDLKKYREFDHSDRLEKTLIFTGSFQYFTNYEAMIWFIGDIYPLVQDQIPDIRLMITGDHANLPLPADTGVELTGFVDDVRPLIARSNICVVPLRQGGGTRLKILEAMALGTPVVSTSKGAEGLDVRDGKHVLIADTPSTFAQAIIRLIEEPETGLEISENAHKMVVEKYNWSVEKTRFLTLVDTVVSNKKTTATN